MDPDSTTLCLVFLIVFLLIRCALAVGQTIVLNLGRTRIEHMAQDGVKQAVILNRLLEEENIFLSSLETGTVFAGLLTGASAAKCFPAQGNLWLNLLGLVAAALVFTLLTTVFAVELPQKLVKRDLEKAALGWAVILNGLFVVLRPAALLCSGTARMILKCVGIDSDAQLDQVTEDEILKMVDVGNEEGNIEQSEKDMITNIFEFDERTAEDVMTHRTDIVAVEDTATVIEVAKVAMEEGFSRIPVYHEDIDDIVGILYAKDLLKYVEGQCAEDEPIDRFMREVLFVPEANRCTELFKSFKNKKIHMAIVVDEYGGTSGLVTMEDLLESIVGNMQDEYDDEEEEVCRISDTEYVLDGSLGIEDVEKVMGVELEEEAEEYDTLGGLITDLLDRIPGENEHPVVQLRNLKLTVLMAKERRILKVRAERLEPEPSAEE